MEAGHGKKKCGKCGTICGVRCTNCTHCMTKFERKVKVVKEKKTKVVKVKKEKIPKEKKVQTYHCSGLGRKQCPSCLKYIGARISVCPCTHVFERIEKKIKFPISKAKDELEAEEFLQKLTGQEVSLKFNIILTPAGKCPVSLSILPNYTSIDEESVCQWCDMLEQHGKLENKFYAPSALRYFIRDFYDVNSEEYSQVCKYIQSWINRVTSVKEGVL